MTMYCMIFFRISMPRDNKATIRDTLMLRIAESIISPSKFCVVILSVYVASFFCLAIVFGLLEEMDALYHLGEFGIAAIVCFALVFILDCLFANRQPKVSVDRFCAKSISVDKWTEVSLTVHHQFDVPRKIKIFDGLSSEANYKNLPAELQLIPGKKSSITYRMKVNVRGPFFLRRCHVKIQSPFKLWDYQYLAAEESKIKVFPDFSAITAFTLLATDNHESQIGIKKKPRRGEGMEFLQLREYRNGDSLRQVDWKATSRRNKIISKEYQDERDQNIVLLIDSGRRMRSKDDTLSHFDHSLNATLLVSYIALRQGDNVSVMSFGNSHRWVAPQKGLGAMKTILNKMYDLHAGKSAPDYVTAAEKFSVLQRKRSLVILVTNSRDEDLEELLMAANLIKRRHVLLLANIREIVVDQMQHNNIESLDDAIAYAGVHQYLRRRQQVQQELTNKGVYSIDCVAKDLAVRVANSYLEIKRSGVL